MPMATPSSLGNNPPHQLQINMNKVQENRVDVSDWYKYQRDLQIGEGKGVLKPTSIHLCSWSSFVHFSTAHCRPVCSATKLATNSEFSSWICFTIKRRLPRDCTRHQLEHQVKIASPQNSSRWPILIAKKPSPTLGQQCDLIFHIMKPRQILSNIFSLFGWGALFY